jgi:hypothetical protein
MPVYGVRGLISVHLLRTHFIGTKLAIILSAPEGRIVSSAQAGNIGKTCYIKVVRDAGD